MYTPEPATDSAEVSEAIPEIGLRGRTLLLAAVFIFLGALWVRYSGLMTFMGNIGNAVPTVPSLAALLAMALAVPVLNRISPRIGLTRREMMFIYAMTLIGVPMSSLGIVRHFLPSLTALHYFATPENHFAELQQYHPSWLVPTDPTVIRTCYEGADNEQVPWGAWVTPLAVWTLFFAIFFFTLMCLVILLRPQWSERERLTFPVVTFALDLVTQQGERSAFSAYLRNPLLWAGFSVAVIFNGLNVLHALTPSVPALGQTYDLGAIFTDRPWTAARPLVIYYRPEFTGIGYLVSTEVLQSTWIFYLLLKLQAVVSNAMGYEGAGIPYAKEQGSGAYVAMAFVFLFMARRQFTGAVREVLGIKRGDVGPYDPLRRGVALIGLLGGLVGIVMWCKAAGMTPTLAISYFTLLITFAITFARIRAEAGVPSMWVFPFEEQKRLIMNITGSAPWSRGGDFRSLTILSTMLFLGRGYFPSMMAYQIENLELSKRTGIRANRMMWGMMFFLVFGLAVAYWTHLTAYYKYGQNVLEGGVTAGGYRTSLARQEFEQLASYLSSPRLPDLTRSVYALAGFLVAVGMVFTRARLLRFPLHPLGYCMATTYGYLLWAPLMLCWIVKVIVLKLGGVKLYQRTVPFFIGLAFGHFFAAGIAWNAVGALLPGEAFREYHVDIG